MQTVEGCTKRSNCIQPQRVFRTHGNMECYRGQRMGRLVGLEDLDRLEGRLGNRLGILGVRLENREVRSEERFLATLVRHHLHRRNRQGLCLVVRLESLELYRVKQWD